VLVPEDEHADSASAVAARTVAPTARRLLRGNI